MAYGIRMIKSKKLDCCTCIFISFGILLIISGLIQFFVFKSSINIFLTVCILGGIFLFLGILAVVVSIEKDEKKRKEEPEQNADKKQMKEKKSQEERKLNANKKQMEEKKRQKKADLKEKERLEKETEIKLRKLPRIIHEFQRTRQKISLREFAAEVNLTIDQITPNLDKIIRENKISAILNPEGQELVFINEAFILQLYESAEGDLKSGFQKFEINRRQALEEIGIVHGKLLKARDMALKINQRTLLKLCDSKIAEIEEFLKQNSCR